MVATTESGMTSSEIDASRGLIQNIMPSVPTMVNTDVMICVALCDSVLAMLSMSLVTRERMSPRELSSKYLSGRRPSFWSISLRRP